MNSPVSSPRRRCLLVFALALACFTGRLAGQAPAPAPLAGIAAAPGGSQVIDELKFNDMDVGSALAMLEDLTGRSVIRPQGLPTPLLTFNSHGPISKQEAVLALESLLSLNGIAIAPMGDRMIKVVAAGNVRTEAPELVVGSVADRPPSGRIVSKLFRLEHLDTNAFQAQVGPFLSPGFGSVVPFQNSNTLLVTDTISNLQRLEYVLSEVDKPRNVVTKFYTLKFAQAQAVAEKIRSLIETTRSAFNRQPGAGNAPGAAGPQPNPAAALAAGGGEAGALGAALLSSTTSLNFDERTNQIILITDPSSVPFYENLIQKLDVQADPSTQIAVIQIQHAQATDVAALLSTFISGSTGSMSQGSSAGAGRTGGTSRRVRSSETFPSLGRTNPATPAVQPANPMVAAAGGAGERTSQFSQFMTIVADERSNAIVASGTQDDLNLVRELIRQVDVILPQVQIDVLIASVTLSNTVQRGIDAFTGIKVEGNKVVGILGSGSGTGATPGVRGPGFDISQILLTGQQSFTANVTNPNTRNNVRVLSVPSITTTHNQEASITVAKALPIITSSYSDVSTTVGARNSYSYQNIGLELTVKPLIGADGTIQMEIEQSADEVAGYTDNTDKQPLIDKRTAKSFISVRDGEIIVLGGLQKNLKGKTHKGLPLISEIPLIGGLFGSNSAEKSRDEILFFIQPRILPATGDRANSMAREILEHSSLRRELEAKLRTTAAPAAPEPAEGK